MPKGTLRWRHSRRRIPAAFAVMAVMVLAGPAQAELLQRADSSTITYHLRAADIEGPSGLLLMLQGSGCEPVVERPWLRTEPALLAPGYAVLAIEKYGVSKHEPQERLIEGCSPEYWARNTLQRRVLDVLQVIAKLRTEPWWNGELLIYGGSEGGAVAALVAPLVPETRAVVIMSSGIGVTVGDLIRAAVPPPVAAQLPVILEEARANPSGDRRFGGASYAWWADAADVTPARALLQTEVPVLLIQGTRDQYAPVATARAARDLFASVRKRNLTYREYEGYDHFMHDPAGVDHSGEVLRQAAAWLSEQALADAGEAPGSCSTASLPPQDSPHH